MPAKKPARKAKNVVEEDSDEEEATSRKPTKRAKLVVEEEDDSDAEPAQTTKAATPPPARGADASDSELSSLLDESPAKGKRQKKAPAAKKKEPAKPKAKAASKAADDPEQLRSNVYKAGWSNVEFAKSGQRSSPNVIHRKRRSSI